jgi:HK97 family phage major capsid protein
VEKELKELAEQLNAKMADFEKLNKTIQEELKGKVDATALDKLKEAADKAGADVVKLNEEFEKFQLRMKETSVKSMSFGDALKAAFKPEDLKGMNIRKGEVNKGFRLDVDPYSVLKADMTAGTNLTYGTFASSVVEPVRVAGVAKAPDRAVSILDMVNIGQLAPNQPRLTWVERSARTEGAAARKEGAKMGNSDFTYIQKSTDVQNISTYVKTTRESLEYWDQLLSEIRIELVPMLQRKLDDYLLTGNGTPPQLAGITTLVNAFTYTGLNTAVVNPSVADSIYAGLTQIYVNKYRPNGILMHPTDVAKMNLIKDKNEQYVLPPFMSANGIQIDGIPVKVNTGITAGHVLLGDFTKASVWFRKGIDIRIWDQNEDDVLYNNVTITADMAAAFKIPTVNYDAFVYDAIADIQAAIAKV